MQFPGLYVQRTGETKLCFLRFFVEKIPPINRSGFILRKLGFGAKIEDLAHL